MTASIGEAPATTVATANAAAPGLELIGVSKRFGDDESLRAVNGISLTVAQGEFFSLLGPSGSGKSTTLNLVAGFLQPDAGHIRIGGQPADKLPPEKRDVGIVFQSYALFPHMSVGDNVAYPLKRRGVRGTELRARVGAALERVGLSDRIQARPGELSGGQQQRAALARALVYEPKLILLDEPLGALDRRLRQHLQEQLRLLHSELKFTALYVTHDQEEAFSLSDRVGIMNGGQLIQIGTGRELYGRPMTLFSARFVGDANVVTGTVLQLEAGRCVVRTTGAAAVVSAVAPSSVSVGDEVAVVARPEALAVRRTAPDVGPALFAAGVLVERAYLAQDLVSLVRVPGDEAVVRVRERPSEGDDTLAVGDHVTVLWRDDQSAIALPDDVPRDAVESAYKATHAVSERS